MILPFRNLITEVFGYTNASIETEEQETEDGEVEDFSADYEEYADDEEPGEDETEAYKTAQKIAVQILTQLEFSKQTYEIERIMQICRAIVKTAEMQDYDVMMSLVYALKNCKEKQVKFLTKELVELFD